MTSNKAILYGPDGEKLDIQASMSGTARERKVAGVPIMRAYQNFVSSIYGIRTDPIRRATDPFSNHAWVYAAAMVRAINISQAPFMVYQETVDTIRQRQEKLVGKGLPPEPPRAKNGRRAVHRHLSKAGNPQRFSGAKFKGAEPILGHPLMDTMLRANPHMTGAQLWQATELFMALRGECFWVLAKEGASRLQSRGEFPEEIYPISPDLMEAEVDTGRLVAWRYKQGGVRADRIPAPVIGDQTGDIMLLPWEVIHFRYVNPDDSLRGYSPLIPVASTIAMDMTAKTHNMSVIKNGANPGGILIDKNAVEPWSADEEKEFLERWQQRHGGAANRGELAILTGGLEYIPTGMSMRDMEYLDSMRYNREEVFATMRVPKTVVGITDTVNYATQLGQDANLWDKCLLPEVRYFEDVIDGSLLFKEPDSVFAGFDLSGVEALRSSLGDKISMVNMLTAANIHMSPKEAFTLVGLEVPDYEGGDKAFVGPMTVGQVLAAAEAPPGGGLPGMPGMPGMDEQIGAQPPAGAPPQASAPPQAGAPEPQPETPPQPNSTVQVPSAPKAASLKRMRGPEYWNLVNRRLYSRMEPRLSRAWRGFVKDVRQDFMDSFDGKAKDIEKRLKAIQIDGISTPDAVSAILPARDVLGRMIESQFRQPLMANLMDVFNFTAEIDFGGVANFAVDDPRLMSWFDRVDDRLADTAAITLQQNIRNAVRVGMEQGETMVQIRQRVSQVFRISESDSKALTVARTESGAFLNNARQVMHAAQGFTLFQWSTAQDELVRESHSYYGSLPPQEYGYQYAPGLRFPHDPACTDASEVVNCRCVLIPIE